MAKKPAKASYTTKSKTQDKKEKECGCGGRMEWTKVVGRGGNKMTFVCNKCGQIGE